MSVIDSIVRSSKPTFSFEVVPPLKGSGLDVLTKTIDILREFDPKYINITTHRSEEVMTELPDGFFKRTIVRRRPGTVAVAAALQYRYGIPVVPHILCSGFSREETEYVLLDLQFLGITDLLVLRGDKAKQDAFFKPTEGGHTHATEAIEQINRFNEGFFDDGSAIRTTIKPFGYGVACYPEKHEEAANMESDMMWFKKKVELGATYGVTQLFYDNGKYFDFVRKAREMGIDVPIVAGIKPLAKLSHISILPKVFRCDLPEDLMKEAVKCKTDADVAELGVEWATAQCRELLAAGVPGLHFYTVSARDSVRRIAENIY